MSISDRARRLVVGFLAERGRATDALTDTTPLVTNGLLDSIDVLTLVLLIEEEFGFAISPLDVSLDQLDSIDRIRRFVERKINGQG